MSEEIKAFGIWNTTGIKIQDPGLRDYISLNATMAPKTGARYVGNKFHKSKVFIIERFMNKIMVAGHKGKKHFKTTSRTTGKANKSYKIMKDVLQIIEQKTKQNPIAVVVKAIENAAPREEIVTIEYGGARYPKAVDCSPQRRIDLAIRYMTQNAYHTCFGTKKRIENVLSDEILAAYHNSNNSAAIAKKLELERQSDASR